MNESIGCLNPSEAFERSRSILSNMSLAEFKSLQTRDPELAQHYEESFPDVIELLHVKEWGGFSSIEEAQNFIDQNSPESDLAYLMAWGGFKSEEEAQAFIDANIDS